MSSKLVFTDVRVFTGTEVLERAYVIVDNGLIKSVGTGSPPEVQGATVINKAGHTLLPGFIDAHIHADKGKTVGLVQSLRLGVTTVMDMHNETENVLKLKKFAKDNVTTSADFKAAGVAATIDGGWPIPVVTAHDKSEEVSTSVVSKQWQAQINRIIEKAHKTNIHIRPKLKSQHGPNLLVQRKPSNTSNSTCLPKAALTTSNWCTSLAQLCYPTAQRFQSLRSSSKRHWSKPLKLMVKLLSRTRSSWPTISSYWSSASMAWRIASLTSLLRMRLLRRTRRRVRGAIRPWRGLVAWRPRERRRRRGLRWIRGWQISWMKVWVRRCADALISSRSHPA